MQIYDANFTKKGKSNLINYLRRKNVDLDLGKYYSYTKEVGETFSFRRQRVYRKADKTPQSCSKLDDTSKLYNKVGWKLNINQYMEP